MTNTTFGRVFGAGLPLHAAAGAAADVEPRAFFAEAAISGVATEIVPQPDEAPQAPVSFPELEDRRYMKRTYIIREDQNVALGLAVAAGCKYGRTKSDILQNLLDLHGFCSGGTVR